MRIALLELIDRAQRLQVVLEPPYSRMQSLSASCRHAERRVAQIMRQRDGFGQRLVKVQRARTVRPIWPLDRVRHAVRYRSPRD